MPYRIIFGEFDGYPESHHFTILTTDREAIVFNTYGGVEELIINIVPLDVAVGLIERLRQNDVSVIKPLFGIDPDYTYMDITVALKEQPLILPSIEELRGKIYNLAMLSHNPHDRVMLLSLLNI